MANRIVVGVDGSSTSRLAVRWAAEEAVLRKATLEAVFVWSTPHHVLVDLAALPSQQELEAAARRTIDSILREEELAGRTDVEIESVVAEGSPASVLLDAALGAALLVVGSRGMGNIKGLMLGSVSLHCVTQAECPVVVVHASADES